MTAATTENTGPPENRPRATATIQLPGTKHTAQREAIIDTGGQVTFAAQSLFDTLNGVIEYGYPYLLAANRRPMDILGAARLTITVPPFDARTVHAYIAKGDLSGTDILIGMDYLSHFDFAVRKGTFGEIRIGGGDSLSSPARRGRS